MDTFPLPVYHDRLIQREISIDRVNGWINKISTWLAQLENDELSEYRRYQVSENIIYHVLNVLNVKHMISEEQVEYCTNVKNMFIAIDNNY